MEGCTTRGNTMEEVYHEGNTMEGCTTWRENHEGVYHEGNTTGVYHKGNTTWRGVPWRVYHNSRANNRGNTMKGCTTTEGQTTDILPSSISKILETNIAAAISKRKINHTGGLPENITLITNQQYDLISNIDVNDGLINGTQCIIKYIQTTKHNDNILPYVVWVDFQNPDIGSNHRHKYTYLYSTHNTNRQWTPIIKIKRTFIAKDHWIHRIQFPL